MISYFSFPVSAFDFHSVFLFAFVCCDFRVFENTAQQLPFLNCFAQFQLTTLENSITYHNALCLSPHILHRHLFQFLWGHFNS